MLFFRNPYRIDLATAIFMGIVLNLNLTKFSYFQMLVKLLNPISQIQNWHLVNSSHGFSSCNNCFWSF